MRTEARSGHGHSLFAERHQAVEHASGEDEAGADDDGRRLAHQHGGDGDPAVDEGETPPQTSDGQSRHTDKAETHPRTLS